MAPKFYFFAFLGLLVLGTKPEKEIKKPNIIYILADDMGYGDVNAFNALSKIKTPNLDKMCSRGMVFTDMHTTSAVCTPTRYGILMGRYNWRSPIKQGVLGGDSQALVRNGQQSVAAVLKKSGYHTAYIGKWHLGWDWAKKEDGSIDFTGEVRHTPNDLGFDYAYGHCGSLDMPPYVYVENGKPTAVPDSMIPEQNGYAFYRKGWIANDFKIEDVTPNFFRRADTYIRSHAGKDRPFFLYLPLPSPHTPIVPVKEWQGKSGINPYADFVMMIDDYIGRLLQTIKDSGIEENTMVIFTSDNGCSPAANFNVLAQAGHDPSAGFRGHKADIFEGGHHVPFIVNWPARIRKSGVVTRTSCTLDFLATVAEIVQYPLKENEGVDSYSFLNLLENPDGNYGREFTIHHSINGSFAIRKGDWKLELCPGSGGWSAPVPGSKEEKDLPPVQLYNMKYDQGETKNVYRENPVVVKELYRLLLTAIDNGRTTPGKRQPNDPPLQNREWKQLDALRQLNETLIKRL